MLQRKHVAKRQTSKITQSNPSHMNIAKELNTKYELPLNFVKGENYSGKNIVSFSRAGRYFTPGSDESKPIVISGPIQDLFAKLVNECGENEHLSDTNKLYLHFVPSSFINICHLIQVQYPDIFIHLVTNRYMNDIAKTNIVISGRVKYNYKIDNQSIDYYPSNRLIIIRKEATTDKEYIKLTGYNKADYPYKDSIPIVTQQYYLNNFTNYQMNDMKKFDKQNQYSEDQIKVILDMEIEVLKNGIKYMPDVGPTYEVMCQWITEAVNKIKTIKTVESKSKKGIIK